jgi:hypothetical protein
MAKFKRFAPITKVDAEKREVWGILAEEAVDKSNEIFDYDKSKPYFQKWNGEFQKLTCQLDEPSLGNLREMHGKTAAGKFTAMQYDDTDKCISVCAKVVDDAAWKKVAEGVYTGFSIGGDYVETFADPVIKGAKRYVANPREGSLVDNPCMYGATFEVRKADGETELRKFVGTDQLAKLTAQVSRLQKTVEGALRKDAKTKKVAGHDLPASAFLIVGDPDKTDTWNLPVDFPTEEESKSHVQNAMARFNQTEGHSPEVAKKLIAHAKKLGIDCSNFAEEYVKAAFPNALAKRAAENKLQKSMWDVGRLADALCTLAWMEQGLSDEAVYEDDDSPIPAKLRELLLPLRQILLDLVAEESAELLRIEEAKAEAGKAAGADQTLNKRKEVVPMTTQSLQKSLEAGTATPEEVKKAASLIKKQASHIEKLEKAHEKMSDAHDKMGEHIEGMKDCMGMSKAADGDHMKGHMQGLAKNHVTLGDSMDDAAGYLEDMKEEAESVDDQGTQGPAKFAVARLEKRLKREHAREIAKLQEGQNDLTKLLTKFIEVQTGIADPPARTPARTAVTVEKTADGGTGVGAIITPGAGAPAAAAATELNKFVDASGMPNPDFVDTPEARGTAFAKAAKAIPMERGNPFPSNKAA